MLKNYLKNSGCGYYAGKRNNFFNYNFLENLHGDQQLFNGLNLNSGRRWGGKQRNSPGKLNAHLLCPEIKGKCEEIFDPLFA